MNNYNKNILFISIFYYQYLIIKDVIAPLNRRWFYLLLAECGLFLVGCGPK